jgi:hypothetical protein
LRLRADTAALAVELKAARLVLNRLLIGRGGGDLLLLLLLHHRILLAGVRIDGDVSCLPLRAACAKRGDQSQGNDDAHFVQAALTHRRSCAWRNKAD